MFWGFVFVDSLNGFAYDQMNFKKTTDGGETWNYFSYSLPEFPLDLGFVNINIGLISGTNGYLAKTTNGGLSWVTKSSGTTVNLKSISIVDSLNTYICGDEGTILKSSDGGETWGKEQTKIVANLNQIRFYKNIAGYVVGDGGVILKKQLIFTDIKKDKINNFSFNLLQNYPNPFNPGTRIRYEVAEMTNVKIIVYDILGRKITELVNEIRQAGSYDLYFDAAKYGLSSGVYIYRISAGKYVQDKKMIFIK